MQLIDELARIRARRIAKKREAGEAERTGIVLAGDSDNPAAFLGSLTRLSLERANLVRIKASSFSDFTQRPFNRPYRMAAAFEQ